MNELHSFDKYKQHRIFIELEGGKYYAKIYFNGTCVKELSGYNESRLFDNCVNYIDLMDALR